MESNPADPQPGPNGNPGESPDGVSQGPGLIPLLSVLRRQGDEVQFTRALAAIAGSDPRFASDLVRAVLDQAPNRETAEALLESLPNELVCKAEQTLPILADGARGRIDLEFKGEDGFHLLIEAKIFADYYAGQLTGYLDASGCKGLVGLVRNPPPAGTEPDDRRWLGSVRWEDVLGDWLSLEHADPSVTIAWRQLLEVAKQQGDLGLMNFNHFDIRAWNRYKEGQGILMSLLNEICDDVQVMMSEEWKEAYGDSSAEPEHVNVVDSRMWNTQLFKRFDLPNARGADRFQISFVGGRKNLLFTAEARWGGDSQELTDEQLMDPELHRITTALKGKGFEADAYFGNFWTRPHEEARWLKESAGDTQIALLDFARKDFRDLLKSGLFLALPTTDIPQ